MKSGQNRAFFEPCDEKLCGGACTQRTLPEQDRAYRKLRYTLDSQAVAQANTIARDRTSAVVTIRFYVLLLWIFNGITIVNA